MESKASCLSRAIEELVKLGREKYPELRASQGQALRLDLNDKPVAACFIGFAALGAGASMEKLTEESQHGTPTSFCQQYVRAELIKACKVEKGAGYIEDVLHQGVITNDTYGLESAIKSVQATFVYLETSFE